MYKVVSIYNIKGGVGKTTLSFNLGCMLASFGKRVLLVDADPQCNLSGLALGFEEFERISQAEPNRNLWAGLNSVFSGAPKRIEAVDCYQIRPNLFLLPGSIKFAEYETTLGLAQELSGNIPTFRNIPGSLRYLIKETAKKLEADFVLIDTNPAVSSINKNLVTTSDYLLVPAAADYFSVMAIETLARVLPEWLAWAERASVTPNLLDADYPFPAPNLKLLGAVVQNLRNSTATSNSSTASYWLEKVEQMIETSLLPKLPLAENSVEFAQIVPDIAELLMRAAQRNETVFELTGLEKAAKQKQQAFESVIVWLANKFGG